MPCIICKDCSQPVSCWWVGHGNKKISNVLATYSGKANPQIFHPIWAKIQEIRGWPGEGAFCAPSLKKNSY